MVSRKYLILLASNGLVVAADQLTKSLVLLFFHLGDTLPVVPGLFNLTRAHNAGAAFGLLATLSPSLRDPLFLVVPILTLLVILGIFSRLDSGSPLGIYALSFIVGGALGNIIDRLRLGFVIDFLDVHLGGRWHFPAFNIADMAISSGVALLLLGALREKDSRAHSLPEKAP